MDQAVNRQSVSVEAWLRSQSSPCEIFGWQSGSGRRFSPSTWVFSCQYNSTNAQYSSSSTFCSFQKNKRAKPGKLPKIILFRKSDSIGYKSIFTFCIRLYSTVLWLWRLVTCLLRRRPGFDPSLVYVRFCCGQSGNWTRISSSTRIFPYHHSTDAPYSSSSTRCSY